MDVKAVQVKLGKRRLAVGERYLEAVKRNKKALAGDNTCKGKKVSNNATQNKRIVNLVINKNS
ncbi:MAG: hypothetical protein IT215_09355 [Chitinophagaceae bacterium]|nr:hypothetical protein [Chitinophagaceae bacterium]